MIETTQLSEKLITTTREIRQPFGYFGGPKVEKRILEGIDEIQYLYVTPWTNIKMHGHDNQWELWVSFSHKTAHVCLKGEEHELVNNSGTVMNQFEKVVVYYDNGQEALGAIIDTLLITKNNVEHRIEFDHKEKRLFQVSDMLTFIDKIVYKHNHNIPLTRAEKYFFSVKDILGIIRQLKNKRL